jgi:hypothetical protein
MSFSLRTALRAVVSTAVAGACLTLPAYASAIDESIPNPDGIAQLELRASVAKPRDQPYLYTQLAHIMTELAGRQLSDGDTSHAAETLQKIDRYAHLIHAGLAKDTWRLKEAEMLMNHTSHRLGQLLHLVSGDDKTTVQATLAQLDQVNDELLTQVFKSY